MIYDQIEASVRGLQALGVSAEAYGSLLIPIMMNKLPGELKLIITRRFEGETWELCKLLQSFKQELEVREKCSFMSNISSTVETKKQPPQHPTAATLMSTDKPSPTCTYCKQHHLSASCPIVSDVKARKDILRKKGRCFVCLKGQHISKNCTSNLKCSNVADAIM